MDQILGMITKKKAERLLVDWANLGYGYKTFNEAFDRMMPLYPEVFATITGNFHHLGRMSIHTRLREAWDAPDQRHREWYIFRLRWDYWKEIVMANIVGKKLSEWSKMQGPPEITPFEAAVFHLQRISDRLRHCQNPNCHSPYFIAMKRGQKYCDEVCARPAQREAKRKWWRENRAKGGGDQ